jgi:hypothetical protein
MPLNHKVFMLLSLFSLYAFLYFSFRKKILKKKLFGREKLYFFYIAINGVFKLRGAALKPVM